MQKDERDLLEVLKFELEFLEKGGYGRSPRTPWRPQYIFEDSLTCMNYDSKENPGPCSDCVLMQLVPPERRSEKIPCRHIPFNVSGETLDSLYQYSDQNEIEETVGGWLRATIQRLEEERAAARQAHSKQPPPGGGTLKGTPLYENARRNPRREALLAVRALLTCFHSGVRRRQRRHAQGALAGTPRRGSPHGVVGNLTGVAGFATGRCSCERAAPLLALIPRILLAQSPDLGRQLVVMACSNFGG